MSTHLQKPPFGTLIGRALRLRCPRCGEGKMFRNLFRMNERCAECHLKYERAPGYFLGSIYINYGLTAMTVTAGYLFLDFVTDVPDSWLMPILGTYCILFPLMFYRYARALWLAMDSFFDTEDFWTGGD